MTARRLPRTSRGCALPRGDADPLTWPPALRGRSPLLSLALLGWLGGGLFATAVALMAGSPTDLTYGLTNLAAACAGLLLLLAASGLRTGSRRSSPAQQPPGAPVPVPAQAAADHDDRRAPALR